MTEQEFIRQAKNDWPDDNVVTLKDALEACYGNGMYDDIGGDVEAPTGHYYRCERWIVTTDSQGFSEVHSYGTVAEAEKWFTELENEYGNWLGD